MRSPEPPDPKVITQSSIGRRSTCGWLDAGWDGTAYRIDRPASTDEALVWRSAETWSGEVATCLHYCHTLDALVGGLCDAGFDIVGLREPDVGDPTAEPSTDAHVAAYFPPFIRILARRRGDLGLGVP